jgi:transposase
MKTQDARTLSPDALFDLRTRVVAAARGGMGQSEAARVFAVHRSAVNRWCQARSADDLRPRRRGRKAAGGPLPPDQEAARLEAIRTRHPDDLGVTDTLWTRDAVAEYAAERFGVRRSRPVRGRWRRRHGFAPQRPARRAYQQDPADLARWRAEVHPAIAAEARKAGAEIHRLDETGVRTDHNPGTGYSPRGRPPVVRVGGRPHRVNAVSTLTNAGRVRFGVVAGRFTAAALIGFLTRLLGGTTGPVFLILDGHPVHRSRRVREWAVGAAAAVLPAAVLPGAEPDRVTEQRRQADRAAGAAGAGPGRAGRPSAGVPAGGAAAAATGPAVLPGRTGHLRRITVCRSFIARGNNYGCRTKATRTEASRCSTPRSVG